MTEFFNTEYPRVDRNSNKISLDGAFVTRDVRSIVLGTVASGFLLLEIHPRKDMILSDRIGFYRISK